MYLSQHLLLVGATVSEEDDFWFDEELEKKEDEMTKTVKTDSVVDSDCDPEITVKKHPDVCYSLTLMNYDSCAIYLGNYVHPEDIKVEPKGRVIVF